MAFEDTYVTRLKSLLKDPKNGIKKITPFIKSRTDPYYRTFLETLHIYTYTKPYYNHEALLPYVGFRNGFFVQCGGNDGYSNDPTYHLEKVFGWKGIIVEPLPIYKLCKKNRPNSVVYNCATGPFTNKKDETAVFIDCNAMSFVEGSLDEEQTKEWIKGGERSQQIKAKRIIVPIKPVQELIDEYVKTHGKQTIDLFVADTEGYEFSILQGLDFSKNSPHYILLEIHKDSELEKITNLLKQNNYTLLKIFEQRDFLFTLKK